MSVGTVDRDRTRPNSVGHLASSGDPYEAERFAEALACSDLDADRDQVVCQVVGHGVGQCEVGGCGVWYDSRVENRIASLVVDAADAETLARFWSDVLGWQIIKRGNYGATIADAGGALEIDFRTVTDGPKATKNRLHLDIKPVNRGQDDELERLLALGARRVEVGQRSDVSWYVLADVEGNEFCLCRPDST